MRDITVPSTRRFRSSVRAVVGVVAVATVVGCAVSPKVVDPSSTTLPGVPTNRPGSHAETITVGNVERTFSTYVPAGLGAGPVPMVVMLHGGFGSARQAESAYGWDAMADAHRFIVVYPNGIGRSWNAGTCCGPAMKRNVDDVAFITQVVASVERRHPIDRKRVFVTGMSNGAMMAERLACETTVFAAVASVAGAQMVPCDAPSPVSMLHIHGLADHNVPFDGSQGTGRATVPVHPPVTRTIDAWRRIDGCSAPVVTVEGVVTRSVSTCENGRGVELVTVAGAGHQWPGSKKSRPIAAKALGIDQPSTAMNATDEIWSFFEAHPAPA